MKENKYDDEIFFEKYAAMPRSKEGLSAAGEWHELEKLLPDFLGKRVLDLGCGYGWHCIYAAEHGASKVAGVDISQKMLTVAKAKAESNKNVKPGVVEFFNLPIEDIDFPENSFDLVISSLALHYVPSFLAVAEKVFRCLAPGGSFVFSAEHPVFTARGNQAWITDEKGTPLFWPVDNYFTEGERSAVFLGETVTKYHRTLTTYINTLLKEGFTITAVNEPAPSLEMLAKHPEMENELKRPMMLIIAAQKM